MRERPQIDGEPCRRRLVEPPALAQRLDQAGVAAGRDHIGIDRIAGCCFQQQESTDDDDQQHWNAGQKTAADEIERAGHGHGA